MVGRGTAALCWGQRYIWLNHHQLAPTDRHELNISLSYEPPPGSTVDSLRSAVDQMVRRHEALRTTVHDTPGGPVQRVDSPGPAPVTVYDSATGGRPATAVIAEQAGTGFRLDAEWPFRACIITSGDTPVLMVVTSHHIAIDDWSLEVTKREYRELHSAILAGRPAKLPPVHQHPVDLARYEASPAARRIHQEALAHWDRVLAEAPADLFHRRRRTPAPGGPAAYSASLSSTAVLAASRTLAARYQVWPSLVWTAAYAALIAAWTGEPAVPFVTYAGNRDTRAHSDLLTCLFQPVVVELPVDDDPTFPALVQRVADRTGQALAHSYCAYDEAVALVARRSGERGVGVRLATAFNYLRHGTTVRGGTRTLFTWNAEPVTWARLDNDSYLRVHEWQDCVVVTLTARSTVFGRDDMARFLRGLERLLLAEAAGDAPPRISALAGFLGLDPPAAAPAGSLVVGHTTVDPAAVAACLEEVPGVRLARVHAHGAVLTGYVVADDPAVTPGVMRTHLLGRMYDVARLRCPDRFVVVATRPTDPDEPASWSAADVTEVGDGVGDPVPPSPFPAAQPLAAAVAEVNRLPAVDLARSYVDAGGRVLDIPRVLSLLRDRGWIGPTVYDVASGRPLAALAAMFVPVQEREPAGP
jgi:hypothetical protein